MFLLETIVSLNENNLKERASNVCPLMQAFVSKLGSTKIAKKINKFEHEGDSHTAEHFYL